MSCKVSPFLRGIEAVHEIWRVADDHIVCFIIDRFGGKVLKGGMDCTHAVSVWTSDEISLGLLYAWSVYIYCGYGGFGIELCHKHGNNSATGSYVKNFATPIARCKG